MGSRYRCTAPVRHGPNATVQARPIVFVYQPRVLRSAGAYNVDPSQLISMYRPLVSTLVAGFAAATPPWPVFHGFCGVNTWARVVGGHQSFRGLLNAVRPGDIFIWVSESLRDAPLHDLSAKGARIVHYQTENVGSRKNMECNLTHGFTKAKSRNVSSSEIGLLRLVDEVWSYDWRNVESCLAGGVVARYVPPGAVSELLPPANLSMADELLFLGKVDRGQPREYCVRLISGSFALLANRSSAKRGANRSRITTVSGAFSDRAQATIFERASAFLQLSQETMCIGASTPARWLKRVPATGLDTFRVVQLLRHRAFVIGHRTNPRDEQEFAGIMSFVRVGDIAAEFVRFRAMSLEDRARIVEERCSSFRQRFAPRAIFERAGVYSSGILRGASSNVTGAPTSVSVESGEAEVKAKATGREEAEAVAEAEAEAERREAERRSVQMHRVKHDAARKSPRESRPVKCSLFSPPAVFSSCMLKNSIKG